MSSPHEPDRSETRTHSEYRVDETPAETVVTAVAEATGQSPLEIDPRWEAADTDALNVLFSSSGECFSSVTVTFDYCGQRVTVTTDRVQIAPSSSETEIHSRSQRDAPS